VSEKNLKADFYVYVIFRPSGVPCYVGKGRGRRWLKPRKHNPHLTAILKAAGGDLPRVRVRQSLTEAQAFETEIAFIKAIGREVHGGPLVNMTDGGDGPAGHRHTEETRAKFRHPLSDDHKRLLSLNHQGMLGKTHSEEARRKIAAAVTRQHETMRLSADARARVGAAAKANMTPEQKKRMADGRRAGNARRKLLLDSSATVKGKNELDRVRAELST
jgi:hypothetical protein